MAKSWRELLSALVVGGVSIPFLDFTAVAADTAKEIDQHVGAVLKKLYQTKPLAKDLGARAKGILVFPKITKAGFLVGGAYGEGELLRNGKTVAYYSSSAGSYRLTGGVQWVGDSLILMTD